jgi:superfamily II DNA or RNA helicase
MSKVELRPYQSKAVREIFEHWRNGILRVLLQMPTGAGKCLTENTPVLMHDGTVKMVQNVQVGDVLMGDDSMPRKVLSATTGSEMCYDIIPVKGEKWGCNESHILSLVGNANQGWIKKDRVYDIELRDYLKLSSSQKHILKQYRVGVEFDEHPVPMPYLLGLWLGDGTASNMNISNPDQEVIDSLRLMGLPADIVFQNIEKRPGKWQIKHSDNPELSAAFKSLKLRNNKHIPDCYKYNSQAVRLQLLAGLIDTDGHLNRDVYEITAKSDTLADDILFLCRSLGFAAYKTVKNVTLKGWAESRPYNRISISGHLDTIPVRIARKKCGPRKQIKNVLRTGFSVVPRGVETYYGFEIDGNRRFLLGDFTVTHNTVLFNYIAKLCVEKGYRVLIIADRKELINQAWEKLWKAYGIHAGIIMAGQTPAYQLQVQIASIQTLSRRTFPPDIDLVIIDECRGSVSPSYAPVFSRYPEARFLGVDATPIRTSGDGFDKLYQALVLGPNLAEMEDIWRADNRSGLVPAEMYVNPFNPMTLSKMKVTGGDYNEKQLAEMMMSGTHTADLVASWQKNANGLKTIAFAVNIAHSRQICEKFRAAGISAAHVDGESPDRDRIFSDFKNGKYRILVNVGIATYGYDEPSIQAVLLARPTMSLALYLQMVGRGARPYPGKNCYILLDHANCRLNHGFPNENRKWQLKGTKKDNRPARYMMKGSDGQKKIVLPSDLPEMLEGVELERITPELERRITFDTFRQRQIKEMKLPLWAYWQFEKRYPYPTREDLEYIQKQLDFKPGWVYVKMKEIEAKQQKAKANAV